MKKAKAKGNAKGNVKANATAKVTYAPFEVADYLDSEEAIAEYLSLAARDENPGVLLKALGDVAKARGMAEVAKASGLGRESLYKTLAPGAKPRFETIATIMRALNVGFSVESRLPVRVKMSGERPRKGGILEALRRSPLISGEIAPVRQFKAGRKVDRI
jgi:probable addiction module antidote protein